ncbi:MAG TPA: arabinose-binding protein, partial [Bacillota bacterium]|nr:arabinose-binding protein [Bacillota bacterium]
FTAYFGKGIFTTLTQIKDEINPTIITEKYPVAIDLLKKNVCFKALKEQSQTPEQALQAAAKELRQK